MTSNTKLDAERDKFITAYRLWKAVEQPDAHPEMVHVMAQSHWDRAAGAMWQAARSLPAQASEPVAPPKFVCDKVERAIYDAKNPRGMHTNGPCMASIEVTHLERLYRAVSVPAQGEIAKDAATGEQVDHHLDAVLRASGSALKHYSMPSTLAAMRTAIRAAMSSQPGKGEA